MSDAVIKVENLSKKYLLTHQSQEKYTALRDVIANGAKQLSKKLLSPFTFGSTPSTSGPSPLSEDFYALRDVSFEIKQGDRVGIIGRNGAGKSTLLKILSRITEPTSGRIEIAGRVASLLEVGTGFHPELTGRENIYLNGAILGMSRLDIKHKFDEIVAFAEVERFLDTPVKRYSSGMYVRLAFAVAAHLEPEILIVDEVLAVGDAHFQQKCMGKMQTVGEEGRTVLFVSHNMAAIQQLCQNGIVLEHGMINFLGPIQEAAYNYMQSIKTSAHATYLGNRSDRKGNQSLKFTHVTVFDSSGNQLSNILCGQDVSLRFYYESTVHSTSDSIQIAFNIRNNQGYLISNLNSIDAGQSLLDIHLKGYFECHWPRFNLRSGSYDCTLFCSINGEIVDWVANAFALNVEDGDYYGSGKLIGREQGEVLITHSWTGAGQ